MTEEQIHSCTLMLLAPKRRARKPPCKAVLRLEFLLLSEEHSEADDGAVNEQTADDAHDHCLNADLLSVCQDYGKSCKPSVSTRCPRFRCASSGAMSKHTHSHDHEESSQEPPQFHNAAASRVHKVIVRLRFAAYPVGHGRKHIGCDHEQGEEVVVEGGREDDEDEANSEDLLVRC